MASDYRYRFDDERLRKVAEHVRKWLIAKLAEKKSRKKKEKPDRQD